MRHVGLWRAQITMWPLLPNRRKTQALKVAPLMTPSPFFLSQDKAVTVTTKTPLLPTSHSNLDQGEQIILLIPSSHLSSSSPEPTDINNTTSLGPP